MWQATNEVITRVPESTQDEMQTAAESCKRAFQDWSQTTILTRQQMMFRLQNLIRENLVICMLCWVTIRMQNLPFNCTLFHSLTTFILDSLHKKLDGEQHNTEVLIFWMMMFYLSEKLYGFFLLDWYCKEYHQRAREDLGWCRGGRHERTS